MRINDWILIIAIFLICIGVMCFPVGFGVSPKRSLSLFDNLTNLGAFFKIGLILFLTGTVLLIISLLISNRYK